MVHNMEESLRFYQEIVELNVTRRFKAGPSTEIAFLGNGETMIELICNAEKPDINIGPDISWGFEVASLDEFMAFIKEKGFQVHSGPFQPNPQTRFVYVLDPNGMKIQFVEQK